VASYRFCRSDDLPLLSRAHEACYRPHFQELPALDVSALRRAGREIDLWTSSCMVAAVGQEPVAVLLATKRDDAALIWRVGTHPEHLRQGHGRHLLTSLSSKLAILGPRRMLAEVPAERAAARALFEGCGWRLDLEYTDFVLRRPSRPAPASDLVMPITIDDLVSNAAFDGSARRAWERSPATLLKRKDSVRGWAVASDVRIEAHLLFDDDPAAGERRLLALGCADAALEATWWTLLVGQLAGADPRPLRYARVHAGEVPFELLLSWGFERGPTTLGYTRQPQAA